VSVACGLILFPVVTYLVRQCEVCDHYKIRLVCDKVFVKKLGHAATDMFAPPWHTGDGGPTYALVVRVLL
jgi:hypothetical protein